MQSCFAGVNETGSGTYTFTLINMYEDVSIKLFTGGIKKPQLLASTETISFTDAPPLRGHLARTGENDEMRLTWQSAVEGDQPSVQYGVKSGVYTNTVYAQSSTYDAGPRCVS
jgi:hypothetical protein